ncbi:hypothetical protein HII13_001738 [Brettanomyces bruxellensis]|nr:hypothetical protein HII13_001738 [Brettanomyces bruxellensis]
MKSKKSEKLLKPQKLILTDNNQIPQIEDVLPSFEMHNYMFNRTIKDVENDLSEERPPAYESLNGPPLDENGHDTNPINVEGLNTNALKDLKGLKKVDLPIEVKIFVTQQPAKMHHYIPPKNVLTEYKPGEIITGYITVKNCGEEIIPFQMFLVSLEGIVGTRRWPAGIDPQPQKSNIFMQTYDLGASYHPSHICLSLNGPDCKGEQDKLDGSFYGFPESQKLQPGVTYKKFFTFIVPFYTLDTTCPYQIPDHLILPPSFGMNTSVPTELCNNSYWCDSVAASNFNVDSSRGYVFRDFHPGSAMRVRDFSNDYQFVSYSIRAKLIGSNLELNKSCDVESAASNSDLVVINDIHYFIRINTSKPVADLNQMRGNDAYSFYSLPTKMQLKSFDNQVEDIISNLKQKLKAQVEALNHTAKACNANHISCDVQEGEPVQEIPQKVAEMHSTSSNKPVYLNTLIDTSCTSLSVISSEETRYTQTTSMSVSKGLIPRFLGTMTVILSSPKDLSIATIRPKNIEDCDQRQIFMGDVPSRYERRVSASAFSSKSASIFDEEVEPCCETIGTSSISISTRSSVKRSSNFSGVSNSVLSARKLNCVHVTLKFEPKACDRKFQPPKEVTIRPEMEVIDMQSDKSLPVSFDDQYVCKGGLTGEAKKALFYKYASYKREISSLCQKLHEGVSENIYHGISALTTIRQDTTSIKDLFEPIRITDLHWKFNLQDKCYTTSFEVELKVSKKAIKKKYYIPPSFQTFSLGRWYLSNISIQIGGKTSKLKVPLKVA